MANNEEKNIVDKAKNIEKAVKETSKIASNLASGNFIGAAKNAINLLKNKDFRKKLKKKLIMIALQSMIPIIIALCFFGIVNTIKETMIELLSNAGTSIVSFFSEAWKWLTDDYWIDLDKENEYTIETDTGETITEKCTIVDKYVKELGNQGVSIKSLRLLGEADYSNEEELLKDAENKVLVEKYIAEFIRADIITQQPHRRSGTALVNSADQNKVDGGVYFYRSKKEPVINDNEIVNGTVENQELEAEDKDYKQMDFIDFEDFIKKIGVSESDFTSYVENRYIYKNR